jgi:hypothetical protein
MNKRNLLPNKWYCIHLYDIFNFLYKLGYRAILLVLFNTDYRVFVKLSFYINKTSL